MAVGIEAIRERMSGTELARRLGITRSAISQWDKVPAERIGEVSRITGLPPQVLRPDLFSEATQ